MAIPVSEADFIVNLGVNRADVGDANAEGQRRWASHQINTSQPVELFTDSVLAGLLKQAQQNKLIGALVEDTSPRLSANLDVGASGIVSGQTPNQNIPITPNGTGRVRLGGAAAYTDWPSDRGMDGHVLTTNGAGNSSWQPAGAGALLGQPNSWTAPQTSGPYDLGTVDTGTVEVDLDKSQYQTVTLGANATIESLETSTARPGTVFRVEVTHGGFDLAMGAGIDPADHFTAMEADIKAADAIYVVIFETLSTGLLRFGGAI